MQRYNLPSSISNDILESQDPKGSGFFSYPEDHTKDAKRENPIIENNIDKKLNLLQLMFTKFIETNQQDKNDLIRNIDEFKLSVGAIVNDSPRDCVDTPITDKYEENRRSFMFFGSPYHSPQGQQQIQVLRDDIVHRKK